MQVKTKVKTIMKTSNPNQGRNCPKDDQKSYKEPEKRSPSTDQLKDMDEFEKLLPKQD